MLEGDENSIFEIINSVSWFFFFKIIFAFNRIILTKNILLIMNEKLESFDGPIAETYSRCKNFWD